MFRGVIKASKNNKHDMAISSKPKTVIESENEALKLNWLCNQTAIGNAMSTWNATRNIEMKNQNRSFTETPVRVQTTDLRLYSLHGRYFLCLIKKVQGV